MSRKKSTISRRSARIAASTCDVQTVSKNKKSLGSTGKRSEVVVHAKQTNCSSQHNLVCSLNKQSQKCSGRRSSRSATKKLSRHQSKSQSSKGFEPPRDSSSSLTDSHSEQESISSLNDFVSECSSEELPRKKKKANLTLFSEFKPKSKPRKTANSCKTVNLPEGFKNDIENDSDDEAEWVEVNEEETTELDFMNKLLNFNENTVCNEVEELKVTPLTIAVPLISNSKRHSKQDPKVLEALALKRKLKEHYTLMHSVHVLCFLAHSRVVNQTCDSCLCQALGLSLLAKTSAVYNHKTKKFAQLSLWSLGHIEACLVTLLSHQGMQSSNERNSSDSYECQLVHRLSESRSNEGDCLILLVAALRALGFDVRVVLGLSPLPLIPGKTTSKNLTYMTKEIKPTQPKKPNRKIISSDEDDIFSEDSHNHPPTENSKPRISLFAEVFLPKLDRWVCVVPSSPTGVVDEVNFKQSFLYVIGACSVKSADPDLVSYVSRNPVDLSPRYVFDWCVSARTHRIPAERWHNLLEMQSKFFDQDAAEHDALVPKSDTLPTAQRDKKDKDSIHGKLLSQSLPKRMQDFKNHPLYVLPRHLLKFQVIYPTDAIPLGFFHNEPIYSRDCVHLCHTRESWLKEAMVVRVHEKPAKVVKARLSMKRKLLQASDSTPPTVEVFGPWQVEPYIPPIAENGVVPRNSHGNVELFKPCMLPVGCVHLCLSGIQYVAKKLGIDCAEAVVGWSFHAGGWAHPKTEGFVVCKESVPVLIDAWRAEKMNAVKAANEERTERALNNWKRLVRGLFIWHRVKAQFALAPLHNKRATVEKYEKCKKEETTTIHPNEININPCGEQKEELLDSSISFDTTGKTPTTEGWIRLGPVDKAHLLPKIPLDVKKNPPKRRNPTRKRRKAIKYEPSSTEESDPQLPSSESDDSADEFVK